MESSLKPTFLLTLPRNSSTCAADVVTSSHDTPGFGNIAFGFLVLWRLVDLDLDKREFGVSSIWDGDIALRKDLIFPYIQKCQTPSLICSLPP